MKRIFPLALAIFIVTLLISCEEKSDPASDTNSFTKIYANNQFSTAYYPIDMKQTADGGYLMLCEKKLYDSTYRYTYLIKMDKFGKVVKDMELDQGELPYLNPVADLMEVDGSYYFFYMKGTSTYLAKTDADLGAIQEIGVSSASGDPLFYPAAASFDGTNFVLLNYDYANREFVISLVGVGGSNASKSYSYDIEVANEVEGPIIDHFNHTGKQFPFKVGRLSNNDYYFNGFSKYTFSLIRTNLSGNNQRIGGINGQRTHGGVNSIVDMGVNKYALSTFNFGSNYFQPIFSQDIKDSISVGDVGGNAMLELMPDAKVQAIKVTANGKDFILYASNTHTNQIGLYVYDATTGEFRGSKYLGYGDPFEISQLIQTSDEGLAVSGITFTAGRFSRICLFKLSKEELGGFVK